jgi:hypothetical protein
MVAPVSSVGFFIQYLHNPFHRTPAPRRGTDAKDSVKLTQESNNLHIEPIQTDDEATVTCENLD